MDDYELQRSQRITSDKISLFIYTMTTENDMTQGSRLITRQTQARLAKQGKLIY